MVRCSPHDGSRRDLATAGSLGKRRGSLLPKSGMALRAPSTRDGSSLVPRASFTGWSRRSDSPPGPRHPRIHPAQHALLPALSRSARTQATPRPAATAHHCDQQPCLLAQTGAARGNGASSFIPWSSEAMNLPARSRSRVSTPLETRGVLRRSIFFAQRGIPSVAARSPLPVSPECRHTAPVQSRTRLTAHSSRPMLDQ
jgi:hypothetical protein